MYLLLLCCVSGFPLGSKSGNQKVMLKEAEPPFYVRFASLTLPRLSSSNYFYQCGCVRPLPFHCSAYISHQRYALLSRKSPDTVYCPGDIRFNGLETVSETITDSNPSTILHLWQHALGHFPNLTDTVYASRVYLCNTSKPVGSYSSQRLKIQGNAPHADEQS